ncbi:aminopeptidase [Ketogulonicigenium vulgare]|uniref:Aminopeptidase protein n=1 Tax=Ketogulonicigenium vulgare (strain WSH-001) TaxID=759362 RepID=F9Y5R6_KETVW|nr:aminopeptidase [Ketogulonicigenium vulgare]ADO43727.1 putative aminopeptidase [Ketogulonicigenium vulgare Y25]AEM41991.1 aminopeptidase protein [Ketogulonicigenium vulgare WSH-001]ALJ82090.1 peptidase M29 [Ketogulonicigenium vulgare]ANW34714.1 peptidase M29 [Ketogulonicigenium vulgare]AOZ55759.1 putative aminopeptidase [Ketogulonicigenium vulgare]
MSEKAMIDPAMVDRLAEVAVKVGLRLEAGQDLVLTAPTTALPLVRRIVAHAYAAGANVITPILSDEAITLARFENGHDATFDKAADWLYRGMREAFDNNAARLAISGDNPMMLSAQDPAKVARVNRATSAAYKPALEKISGFDINWSIVSYPNPAWAKLVFPDLPEDEAIVALAKAIFAASRVDQPDPVAAWNAHNANLAQKSGWLNGQRFASLHFTGPGTDLMVGLADGHEWHGGASLAKNGITCNPNIPTEEVFTTPHALRVEGYVSATKPLSHNGTLIRDIRVRFEGGRIVEAHAATGEEVLQKVLDIDEGARRLGEVALVPHSSPISASGVLFYNTLFDENAACHIALGQCYSDCFVDGAKLTPEQIKAQGGNSSLIHIDWMIGSGEVDIDGVAADGTRTAVFRRGEWAL